MTASKSLPIDCEEQSLRSKWIINVERSECLFYTSDTLYLFV